MYLALKQGMEAGADELKLFLLSKLETYKVPVDFIIVDELPRNYVGKLDRKKLKAMWEDR